MRTTDGPAAYTDSGDGSGWPDRACRRDAEDPRAATGPIACTTWSWSAAGWAGWRRPRWRSEPGLRTALLEAHTKLGGCAGYFGRGPYTFDAGATALMGLRPGEPIGDLLALLGVDFEGVPTPSYRVHLPDRVARRRARRRRLRGHGLGGPRPERERGPRQRLFWRLQAAVGGTLFAAAAGSPGCRPGRSADLVHDLRILGLSGACWPRRPRP